MFLLEDVLFSLLTNTLVLVQTYCCLDEVGVFLIEPWGGHSFQSRRPTATPSKVNSDPRGFLGGISFVEDRKIDQSELGNLFVFVDPVCRETVSRDVCRWQEVNDL